MEGDSGVKAAPVTRLRRRLSVEQPDLSDTNSPSAPSTPTKKRGGRLAAKPNLELIDENAPQNSPKRATRRSIARDIVEEEKPVTPSRRSTRIKSNTSIVSDTVQTFDSPRAKRAARRTSLVGSDNEAPLTPVKTRRTRRDSTSSVDKASPSSDTLVTPGRTRRTRKDSTSSFDKQADPGPSALITEVISEEPEKSLRKSTGENQATADSKDLETSQSVRKSPRLAKTARKSNSSKSDVDNENQTQDSYETSEKSKIPESAQSNTSKENNTDIIETSEPKDKLSVSSTNLINNLDTELKKSKKSMNKSTPALKVADDSTKRHRTKSWSHLSVSQSNEEIFYSDNESTMKKLKKNENMIKRLSNQPGSSNGPLNTSKDVDKTDTVEEAKEITEIIINSSKRNKRRSESSFTTEIETSMKELTPNKSGNTKALDISNESNKENLLGVHPKNVDSSATELLFEQTPSNDLKSIVFIEDSDTDSVGKVTNKQSGKDDQCVPVVDHKSDDSTKNIDQSVMTVQNKVFNNFVEQNMKTNDNCEPMDIDETMPENVSLTEFSKENEQVIVNETQINGSLKKSKRKSSISNSTAQTLNVLQGAEEKVNESFNKSKRKSSVSNSMSQSFNTSKGSEEKINDTKNKSKRKSSISNSIEEKLNVSQGAEENVNESLNKSKKKSSVSNSMAQSFNTSKGSEEKINETNNKTKKKSSISNSMSPDLEKTGNENKSTLILSQIKDMSTTENNVSKSPQASNELLSKSIDVPDSAKDEIVKNKNISVNYLTSTPVNQKDNKKLGMQMNTSVITPNNVNKQELGESKNISKNDETHLSKASANSDSSEEESDGEEEESSQDKSNIMDDEAEDAGDDYESGDSQDEEERQYEKENEILDRGEKLTSDDEISNDSDYEKDSFIVSSDEEDNDLLSGSGDDLGSSDNELTMSAKSKKKYNEHKLKEQKKASKEMYEARHKLNKSDQSWKKDRIKTSHHGFDSSLLDSDEDAKLPPKKKGRLRLDSSMMISEEEVSTSNKNVSAVSEPEEIGYKKKKSKRLRLSESMCNNSIMNEKEITLCDEGDSEIDDPLIVGVKQEPKTPQKPLDISTVHFTDRQEVEQVELDENETILKINESKDPLQTTIAQDDDGEEESDDGSISENEEIANNYETMLKELNKGNEPKQIKSSDISLNLNQKFKNKNEPIIEQLNLTQTRKSKKNKKSSAAEKPGTKSAVGSIIKSNEDEASSDSIDMKLLFSDDSNNSSEKYRGSGNKDSDKAEKCIPLKRTDSKTNIREDDTEDRNVNFFGDTTGTNDLHTSMNLSLNTSSKKTKNKKNSISLAENVQDDDKKQEATTNFFVDTKGTRADLDTSKNTSLNNSSMKKKNKNNSISFAEEPVQKDEVDKEFGVNFFVDTTGAREDLDTSKNISLNTSQKKRRNKKNSTSFVEEPELVHNGVTETEDGDSNDAPTETSYRSEKNKKQINETSEHCEDVTEKAGNTSMGNTSTGNTQRGEKKKKKKLSETHEPSADVTDAAQNVSLNSSKLDKINTARATANLVKDDKPSQGGEQLSTKKRKRKSSANMSAEALLESTSKVLKGPDVNESTLSASKKKKRKISHSDNSAQNQDAVCSQTTASNPQEINVNKNKFKRSKAFENKLAVTCEPEVEKKGVNKKRKERDDDDFGKKPKVIKENSPDKIHVPRLPTTLLSQLDDKPNREVLETRKANVTSTTEFRVEETVKRKNKPSQYLEESIYLNNSEAHVVKKQKTNIKRPKVLPFIPTASTSDSGFTTKFQVNVLPKKIEFVAQKSDVPNFKNDFLNNNKLKRLRTYELYRNNRSVKLSKY